MRFSLDDLDAIKKEANVKTKTVSQMIGPDGENIYKDILGHEDEINYCLYDLGMQVTGLQRHIICLTDLYPGKINGEYKMTTGHDHPQEEVYLFLTNGLFILGKETYEVGPNQIISIPSGFWHSMINNSKETFSALNIFETYGDRG